MEAEFQKQVVEALIFASDVPLSENKIASIIEELTPKQVSHVVEDLNAQYTQSQRAVFITRIGGGYQIQTHKHLSPWIKQLFKGRSKHRLSQAGLESLAIIAFRQPISRVEIDAIRGVNSGGVVKNLLERNLIGIAGRSSGPGKPLLYATTRDFLQYIGLNDISELPKPKEVEEIMGKMQDGGELSESILQALTEFDENNGQESTVSEGINRDQDEPDEQHDKTE